MWEQVRGRTVTREGSLGSLTTGIFQGVKERPPVIIVMQAGKTAQLNTATNLSSMNPATVNRGCWTSNTTRDADSNITSEADGTSCVELKCRGIRVGTSRG